MDAAQNLKEFLAAASALSQKHKLYFDWEGQLAVKGFGDQGNEIVCADATFCTDNTYHGQLAE